MHLARLQAGETALIHGAAGGVGLALVRLASLVGARVLFTARTSAIASVIDRGGDTGFDYAGDISTAALATTGGDGVDVIVDIIGGANLAANVHTLAIGGRLIQLGLLGGREDAPLPLERVLTRRLSIIGSVMKSRSAEEKAAMTRRFLARWQGALDAGELQPQVHAALPLRDAAQAHRMMEAGGHLGKIVLVP